MMRKLLNRIFNFSFLFVVFGSAFTLVAFSTSVSAALSLHQLMKDTKAKLLPPADKKLLPPPWR